MKKLLFITLAIGFCFVVSAGKPDSLRVDTNDSSFTIKNLTFKKTNAILQLKNGEKFIMAVEKINGYTINGKTLKRLPLYLNGERTSHFVFMELVKNQGEYNLYKYCCWSYNPNLKLNIFLLYNGDKLIIEYDESSHL
jgi:hypothetical protein